MSVPTNSPTPADAALAARTLGRLARELPCATAVFRQYKLDFCCGGDQTLRVAAAAAGIDTRELESALWTLPLKTDETPDEPLALIDHILTRFHETHRRELRELIELARRVEEQHAGHAAVPTGLTATLMKVAAALEQHMQKEEQILFPMMRAGGHPMITHPIGVMQHEHDEHGERLRQLEALTHDHTAPSDACATWLALYAGTRKLVDDVMQHIHLENNVLFPQFSPAATSGPARAAVR